MKPFVSFHFLRATLSIFAVYFYFLIFAQFAFLQLLAQQEVAPDATQRVMAFMGGGGLLMAVVLYGTNVSWNRFGRVLSLALLGCALVSVIALTPLSFGWFCVLAGCLGFFLSISTIFLSAFLDQLVSRSCVFAAAAWGTGLAYGACNLPFIFNGSPEFQTLCASAAVGLAAMAVYPCRICAESAPGLNKPKPLPWMILFTVLIFFDSAAFYVIQHTPALKMATWNGPGLYLIGAVHLLGALWAGLIVPVRFLDLALGLALLLLVGASYLLQFSDSPWSGRILYPLGVSIYSVILVAWPSMVSGGRGSMERVRAAGLLYGVAGWVGSGLGIGMATHWQRIPSWLLVVALIFLLLLLGKRMRHEAMEITGVSALLGVAWLGSFLLGNKVGPTPETPVEKGRQVYVREGCMHCHSQYVRENVTDIVAWGPTTDASHALSQKPPLIGNRRQGPDLSHVGARRSKAWLKAHFLEPRAMTAGTPMPSYAHLFFDDRGEDLIAYLQSLGNRSLMTRVQTVQSWKAPREDLIHYDPEQAGHLFSVNCAGCHVSRPPAGFLQKPAPDLTTGPWIYAPPWMAASFRREKLAQIIKFGINGTDMAGREYLNEKEVWLLTEYVLNLPKGRL